MNSVLSLDMIKQVLIEWVSLQFTNFTKYCEETLQSENIKLDQNYISGSKDQCLSQCLK